MADALLIALLAIIVLGPRKLPELARQIGGVLADLRRGKDDFLAQLYEPEPRSSGLSSQRDPQTSHLVKDVVDDH